MAVPVWHSGLTVKQASDIERVRKTTLNITLGEDFINYDVACNMDFHRFPVDEQYCEVKFESFGFTNKQVRPMPCCSAQIVLD